MRLRWVVLLAYACSGLAGLVYEVSWTRLLTLYMGHTTAAASTVVAAFMGGLAIGAVAGGRTADRLTPRQCLRAYAALEGLVAVTALLLPFMLAALQPMLAWAYRDGTGGVLFPLARIVSCAALLLVPSSALGATFPLAVRWLTAGRRESLGRLGGTLYALNTAGAALGAVAAGFILIPRIGVSGATWVGVSMGVVAIALALTAARLAPEPGEASGPADLEPVPGRTAGGRKTSRHSRTHGTAEPAVREAVAPWMVPTVLAFTGVSSLLFEIASMRVLALALGPTTYAFATVVAMLITGLACGSGVGAWLAGRKPASQTAYLAWALIGASLAALAASALAGGEVPRRVAVQIAASPDTFGAMLWRAGAIGGVLVFPVALGLGAAFPLALSIFAGGTGAQSGARRAGVAYGVNTVAAVAGSLAAGFVTIPLVGVQQTLRLVTALLLVSGIVVVWRGALSPRARWAGGAVCAAAIVLFAVSPPWDRELLASGVYKYSAYVAQGIDVEAALKAGELLYYGEGAASTVTVKRLTGTTTLAIDGKVDASNGSDMLTQKLIAHLPLLLHDEPHAVCIIGVGSGVTLGAALRHPIDSVDVLEISPEVVEASRLFADVNGHALDDPRTHLIVSDGRSHLSLSRRQYDVIISEPSNPWIAGVASLFTREFFLSVQARLAPGGIVSQWAHTYNISPGDLRSIVATFTSVFPNGTVWMVGQDDVLLVASKPGAPGGPAARLDAGLGISLANIGRHWSRPGVAEDLAGVRALEPFDLWSLYIGGPEALKRYSAGATLQVDDRTALEFSGPRAMDSRGASENAAALRSLFDRQTAPDPIRAAWDGATVKQWRDRAAMMLKADVPTDAYDDYRRALALAPLDGVALDGLAQTAPLADRTADAVAYITELAGAHPSSPEVWVTKSKLLAEQADTDGAFEAARIASEIKPLSAVALEHLAAIFGARADADQLDLVVQKLQQLAPAAGATLHYAAVAKLLHGDFAGAVTLARQATTTTPPFVAAFDVLGAAHTRLGQSGPAAEAFRASLAANPHDSTAYANLGILELGAGRRDAAARLFSEALWLAPESDVARQGLAQSRR